MLDTWIEGTGGGIDTLEQFDFFRAADDFQGVIRAIQLGHVLGGERLHRAVLSGAGDRSCSPCSQAQRFKGDGIAVCKTGFLTRLSAYAHALIEIEAAFFDDAVFQCPGLGNLALEIQVCRVDTWPGQVA